MVRAGGAVSVKLTDDEKKFENCVELGVNHSSNTITLTSRMCRTMRKFFLCQRNGLLFFTLYRSNFVAHPLTARFVAVLKHFHFLSFIPSDIVFYSLHFSLAIFIVRRP